MKKFADGFEKAVIVLIVAGALTGGGILHLQKYLENLPPVVLAPR